MKEDVVYSLSKEKAAAWFYVMQCTLPKRDDLFHTPINHVIDSLQGPLVTRSAGQWITTQVAEYFHLLPYAGIVSDWFSSDVPCNSMEDHKLQLATSISSSKTAEKPCKKEVPNNQDHSHINWSIGNYLGTDAARSTKSAKYIGKNEHYMHGSSGAYEGPDNLKVAASSVLCERSNKLDAEIQLDNHQRKKSPILKVDPKDIADVKERSCIIEFRGENKQAVCGTAVSSEDEIPIVDRSLVNYQPNFKDLDKVGRTIASKETILSQAALRVLHAKRLKLTLQQRNIQDQISLCDKQIHKILNGGEDDLAVKIDSVIEGCNDVTLRNITEERTPLVDDQCSSLSTKGKQLSEAVKLNSCQELDYMCHDNNWILPTYNVSPSDGGFLANVTVKGVGFDTSCDGKVRPNPCEARQSAATQMLTNLHNMASQSQ